MVVGVSAVAHQESESLLALLNYLAEGGRQRRLLLESSGEVSRRTQAGRNHPAIQPPNHRTPDLPWRTQAGLLLLAGPPFVLDVGTTLAGWVVLRGLTVLYVDGANAFDPYILSRLARDAGQPPKAVMQRLRLSRAFTCHQLETLIADRLPGAVAEYRPGLVVISGWSHLFHDENVPAREAFRLLQNTARQIRALADAGQPILATHPEEPTTQRLRPLGEMVTRAADGVARLREEEGLILVTREKPPEPHGARPLVISQEQCRLWFRGHHPREALAAYPTSGR